VFTKRDRHDTNKTGRCPSPAKPRSRTSNRSGWPSGPTARCG
jgi:hypothetical protein